MKKKTKAVMKTFWQYHNQVDMLGFVAMKKKIVDN
jgi:hypothetical protein